MWHGQAAIVVYLHNIFELFLLAIMREWPHSITNHLFLNYGGRLSYCTLYIYTLHLYVIKLDLLPKASLKNMVKIMIRHSLR